MSNTTTIYGIFDDEEVLLSSVKEIRSKEIEIKEVYSPFPVHGLDKALGLKETRMAITAFIYGCIGISLAVLMIYNIMIVDWPQNIGGKPNATFYHNSVRMYGSICSSLDVNYLLNQLWCVPWRNFRITGCENNR